VNAKYRKEAEGNIWNCIFTSVPDGSEQGLRRFIYVTLCGIGQERV